jgi:hypothetical protein
VLASIALVLLRFAVSGVGHKPEPVPLVRGTKGRSRKAVPLRVIPERGQVSENALKAPSKQSCDVLHEHVARSKLANHTGVLAPKTRARPVDPGAPAGDADVLAREPSAQDVDPFDCSCPDVPDIRHAKHVRPVLRKNSLAERVDLALPQNSHACSLEAEVEAANA